MSKIRHHNEKPSATGLFTKGQNLVADGQTSKMPSTTSGAGQIETNFGKQQRGCFNSEMIRQVICSRICTISTRMDPCLMIEEIPAHLLRPRVLTRCQNPSSSAKIAQCRHQPHLLRAVHLRQPRTRRLRTEGIKKRGSFQFNCGLKRMISQKAESQGRRSQHGVVFCSQILFLSATVAFRTNVLSLADFKSDLSRTNLKLPSSATWP